MNKKMKVKKIVTIDTDIEIIGATLLSTEEAEKLPERLRKYSNWWWLRSKGYGSHATYVDRGGSVNYHGDAVIYGNNCVRPALKISNLESANFKIGDTFEFGGKQFEVISNDMAFCKNDIGVYVFRVNYNVYGYIVDYDAPDANDYEISNVKKFVDDWFNTALKGDKDD